MKMVKGNSHSQVSRFLTLAVIAIAAFIAGCGGAQSPDIRRDNGESDNTVALNPQVASTEAECIVNDERRELGLDAPAPPDIPVPDNVGSPASCNGNTGFRFGTAIQDATNSITDGSGHGWVNPFVSLSGLHTRLHVRTFIIESACNGKRVVYVLADVIGVDRDWRDAVMAELAADAELSVHYDQTNVMLAATHTHNSIRFGRNAREIFVAAIVDTIRNADINLQANPQVGSIELAFDELLHTNSQRAPEAYALNPESERQQYLDENGDEVRTNREMVQIALNRGEEPAGVINWFGVHGTSLGPLEPWVSSDNKGFAHLEFERLMGTDYNASAEEGTFIAAFAQAEEGDTSPNVFWEEHPVPDVRRGGSDDYFENNAISGVKHLGKALELFGNGEPIAGPIDYQYALIPISSITVTDPVVLASLNHPPEMDVEPKRTCDGAFGVSFGSGIPADNEGPAPAGVTCSDDDDVLAEALADVNGIEDANLETFPGNWPGGAIPSHLAAEAVMCNVALLPPVFGDFSCQAEKPVLIPDGAPDAPIQFFRIGQLVVIGLPWEVSVMSGRRIRKHVLEELAPIGVTKVTISGVTNAGNGYLTTREEYAAQLYEGASTRYGPWTHAALLQEVLRMARDMRNGVASETPAETFERVSLELEAGPQESPSASGFPGDIVRHPPEEVTAGDLITAEIVAGHPDNDLRLQESYVYVEKLQPDGSWESVSEDRDERLKYDWKPDVEPEVAENFLGLPGTTGGRNTSSGGTAEALWQSPKTLEPGEYRFRFVGASKQVPGDPVPYEAITNTFELSAPDISDDDAQNGCP